MENSQPLATESFSYSWLINKQPTFHINSTENEDSFDFDVPVITSLIHADEIFFDGQMMPIYVNRSKVEALKTSTNSAPASPIAHYSSRSRRKKWRESSKRILQKWFGFMKTIGCSSKRIRVDDLERKVFEVQSVEASARSSFSADSVVDLYKIRNSVDLNSGNVWCDDENSVHEAILYCKRSIEK